MNEATDITIKRELSTFVSWSEDIDRKTNYIQTSEISPETFAEVIVQFRALGLVDKGSRRRAVRDRGSYWRLTEQGERYLVRLLAKKAGDVKRLLPATDQDQDATIV